MYQGKKQTAEELLTLIATLIGPVEPTGDTAADDIREQNMKTLIELSKELHVVIDHTAAIYKDSKYGSEKRIGKLADDYLNWLGIMPFIPRLKRMPLGFYSFTPDSVGLVTVGNHEHHSVHTPADAVQIGNYYISIHDLEQLPKED